MEFKEYSKAVMAWVDGVMQNRGADAEKTLKYCADIEQYAKQTGDPKLLGFAYYYAGETYYVLNEGEQLLKTITRAITYLDQAEQWDMVARAYNPCDCLFEPWKYADCAGLLSDRTRLL